MPSCCGAGPKMSGLGHCNNSVMHRKTQTFQLPSEAAGWRWPRAVNLTQKHDAAEVIGVVGGEIFKLVADGHRASGMARRRRAANVAVERAAVADDCCGSFRALQETLTQGGPGFSCDLLVGGKSECGAAGVMGFEAARPLDRNLLPEGDVPDFFVDGVRCAGGRATGECGVEPFDNSFGAARRLVRLEAVRVRSSRADRREINIQR